MNLSNRIRNVAFAGLSLAVLALSGCSWMHADRMASLTLRGSEEVPPVNTSAIGSGRIMVHSDRSVSGSVSTSGLNAMAAHIHQGARGQNGPVVVGLVKNGDNSWAVPAGARLTEAQYDTYRAGNMYVNVHTAAYKDGEIRGQLNP